jgi:dTDP-4-amino-4,6-dideoxygalactose transaminase
MPTQTLPVLDLTRARRRIEDELAARWRRLLDNNAFVHGPEVKEFEQRYAEWLGAAGCVGVANGTDALTVALRALDLEAGDEVLVPAFSFFATAEAVVLAGGRPVFCDIEPATFNLDLADAGARVTARTVGIIGVHLYGRPFDVAAARALAARHGLWLLEDAAQAHGARYQGARVGTLGDLAAWSFYPSKNLGCFGDGGAVTGPRAELLERVRLLANHGQSERYRHSHIGTNSRLDSLQAAVLNCRLGLLDEDNASRRSLAAQYRTRLTGVGDLAFPSERPGDEPVFHQLTVRTARRGELACALAGQGISTAVHYPSPLHRQPALAALSAATPELPAASAAAEQVLCLPMFPELTGEEVERVCAAIAAFYAGAR